MLAAALAPALAPALALACAACPASADTLQQAWDAALAADRGLLAARQNAGAAHSLLQAAQAGGAPRLGVEAGYAVLSRTPAMRAEFLGTPVQLPVAPAASAGYKASVSLPLYSAGRLEGAAAAAEASAAAARAAAESTAQDLKLRVAEAFVGLLKADRAVAVGDSHVARLQAQAQGVQDRQAQGLVARSDLLAVQVSLAEARQAALQLRHAADLARARYNQLLGRPLDQLAEPEIPAGDPWWADAPADVLTDALPDALPDARPLAALVERGRAARSELAQLAGQIEALRRQADAVRAEAGLQVAAQAGYGYQQNRYQVHPGQWFAGVGVAWAVFDGGVAGHRADALEQQAAAMSAQRDDATAAVALQIRQQWLALQEARERQPLAATAVAQAEENLRVAEDRYRQGLTTHTEVLAAQALRRGSLVQDADARFDRVLAGLRLLRALGAL